MTVEYNRAMIRTLSILGQRGAFGYALTELAKENGRILALTADLRTTSGLDRFYNAYPERVINVGIAEQNMIGIAAGVSTLGYIPYATTFSNFAALRSCEQIRHFLGYMNENVKIVGFGAGFAMGMFGTTHYGTEDIAAIRSIPNITIISPADSLETAKATIAVSKQEGPVYLRLTGVMNHPMVYRTDYDYEIGKALVLTHQEETVDITIFAVGGMVYQALSVAKGLEKENISCQVVNVHTIIPIDREAVYNACSSKLIVTVEEHSVIGGLGSAVAETLCNTDKKPPQLIIGVDGGYKPAASYEYMLEQYGLTADHIADKIKKKYSEVK